MQAGRSSRFGDVVGGLNFAVVDRWRALVGFGEGGCWGRYLDIPS